MVLFDSFSGTDQETVEPGSKSPKIKKLAARKKFEFLIKKLRVTTKTNMIWITEVTHLTCTRTLNLTN